jgi:hypothetical protein
MSTTKTQPERDSTSILVEGEDYYSEGATIVFTARFLLRRGYCCESGCRHCPFGSATEVNPSSISQVKEENR